MSKQTEVRRRYCDHWTTPSVEYADYKALASAHDAAMGELQHSLAAREAECRVKERALAALSAELEKARKQVIDLHCCWSEANQALIDIDGYAVRRWEETKDKSWDAVAEMAYSATTEPELLDEALPTAQPGNEREGEK